MLVVNDVSHCSEAIVFDKTILISVDLIVLSVKRKPIFSKTEAEWMNRLREQWAASVWIQLFCHQFSAFQIFMLFDSILLGLGQRFPNISISDMLCMHDNDKNRSSWNDANANDCESVMLQNLPFLTWAYTHTKLGLTQIRDTACGDQQYSTRQSRIYNFKCI